MWRGCWKCYSSSPITGDGFEDFFRQEWDGIEANAERILDRVDDGWSWTIHGKFTNSLCAICPVNIARFFKEDPNLGQVRGGRHNVICHLTVVHASILPDDVFIQGKSDSLGNAARNLAL